jgi:hypothetical protein
VTVVPGGDPLKRDKALGHCSDSRAFFVERFDWTVLLRSRIAALGNGAANRLADG